MKREWDSAVLSLKYVSVSFSLKGELMDEIRAGSGLDSVVVLWLQCAITSWKQSVWTWLGPTQKGCQEGNEHVLIDHRCHVENIQWLIIC